MYPDKKGLKEAMNEIFMIYAKNKESDTVFDYKTAARDWEECTEILERMAKIYDAVMYLHIVEGKEMFERSFSLNKKNDSYRVIRKTESTLKLDENDVILSRNRT